jgi:hypothetical protein
MVLLALLGLWLMRADQLPATAVADETLSTRSIDGADPTRANAARVPPADTVRATSREDASTPPTPARLDRAGARRTMQAVLDTGDCKAARSETWPRYWALRTGVAWLPADEQAHNRAAVKDARQRMLAACRRQGLSERDETAGKPRPGSLQQAIDALAPEIAATEHDIELAANAGDLQAQLHRAKQRRDADVDADIRPLLNAVLAEVVAGGDAELLVDIGRVPAMANGPALGALASGYGLQQTSGAPNAQVNQRALWLLIACDLGMDCTATSPTLDRLCLLQGLCGYSRVEAALRDGVIRIVEAEETEARRQWAVARIRGGQIDGMFDPAAPLPAVRPGGG